MPYSERLSSQDTFFLEAESPLAPQHVASVLIFEAGPLRTEDGRLDIQRIRGYVASLLHRIPRYRQTLLRSPIGKHAFWVDDPYFDLDFHMRHSALPAPGNDQNLRKLVGLIFSHSLDLNKPLWEIWVVEGLSDDRFALIIKVHHCMIDGMGGVGLLNIMHSLNPLSQFDPPPKWQARPAPNAIEQIGQEGARLLRQAKEDIKVVGQAMGHPGSAWRATQRIVSGLADTTLENLRKPSSRTNLNKPIGPNRRVAWTSIPMNEVQMIRDGLGGTINEVVLAISTGILRRHFEREGPDPDSLTFRAGIPVNTRPRGDSSMTRGVKVSAITVELPLQEPNLRRRYEAVLKNSKAAKESNQAESVRFIVEFAEHTYPGIYTSAVRFSMRSFMHNIAVTNVPGPPVPLYFLESRLLHCYPLVVLLDHQALGIAVFSYHGHLHFGFTSDWDLVPDLSTISADTELEHRQLLDLAKDTAPSKSEEIGTK